MNIEIPKSSENYCEKTSRGYEVTVIDGDQELPVEFRYGNDDIRMYFSKADLIMMLSRFNP